MTPGGLVYHVLNRTVAGLPLFRKEADYEAFERIMIEAHAAAPAADSGVVPDAEPLAFRGLAARGRGSDGLFPLAGPHARHAVARGAQHGGTRAPVPGAFQELSDPGGRAFLTALSLRGAERADGGVRSSVRRTGVGGACGRGVKATSSCRPC